MSVRKVLIEGGGETAASALAARVVDEVRFYVSPVLIGGRNAKTPVEGMGIPMISDAVRIKDCHFKAIGKDILVTGKVT